MPKAYARARFTRPAPRKSRQKPRGTSDESPPRNDLKSPGKTGLFSFVLFALLSSLATSWQNLIEGKAAAGMCAMLTVLFRYRAWASS
jgi:hypothetical protein